MVRGTDCSKMTIAVDLNVKLQNKKEDCYDGVVRP